VAQQAALRGHRIAFIAPRRMHHLLRDFDAELFEAPSPNSADVAAAKPFRLADSLRIRRMDEPAYLRAAVRAELDVFRRFSPEAVFTENQLSCAVSTAVAGVPLVATTASVNHERFASPLFGEQDATAGVEEGFNSVAAEYGLDPVSSVPHLLERTASVLVVPSCPELEPLLVGTPNLHFVGPLLYAGIEVKPLPPMPRSRPLVYVYLSAGDVPLDTLLDILREGIAAAIGARFIASARGHFGPAPRGRGTDGVSLIDLPPGITTLAHCDAAITHGGQNTTMACLLTGTPALMIPGTNAERDFNARRLADRGAAIHAGAEDLTADRLAGALRQLTDEPGFARAAAALGDSLREFGGASDVLRLIEQF
jgi:UDP:flavonoid glycosyltransferase YjiC (YdhE family)